MPSGAYKKETTVKPPMTGIARKASKPPVTHFKIVEIFISSSPSTK
jgi:hypothetical protein